MKYRNFTNKLMLMVGVTATAVLTSCEQEFYQDEQYRKEIYIVSGEDNIFQREFSFGGEEIGYLSVYASGTTPIEKEVMVELKGMKLYYRTIIKRDMGIITKTMSWSYQILIIK